MSEAALEKFALGVGWKLQWWHRKLVAHMKPAQIYGIFRDTDLERINGKFQLTFTEKHRFLLAMENIALLDRALGFRPEVKFLKLKRHYHDTNSLQREIVKAEIKANHRQRGVERR